MLSSYGIMGEHVMRICDLTLEITKTKDTVTSTDSELILHRECPHCAVVRSMAISELTGPCKKNTLHYCASRRAYKVGRTAVPCLNCRIGSPAPLAPQHSLKVSV